MAAQHPSYFDAAREAAPHHGKLAVVVTVRQAGKLVGLWPLSISNTTGVCRIAHHPGDGVIQEHLGGALVAPGADPADVTNAAVAEIRKHADLIEVSHLPPHARLIDGLRRQALASLTSRISSSVVDLANAGSWENWLKSKSAKFRQDLGRNRRNLAKLGLLESVQDEPSILPWFFREKRKWLEKTNKQTSWISNPDLGERFYTALAAQPVTPLKTFALKMDGAYIAAAFCAVGDKRLEYNATVYDLDSQWAPYSPGMLISEDCGRWAAENGLDLDLLFVDFPWKQRWTSRTDRFVSVSAAFSPIGMARLYAREAKRQARRVRVRAATAVKDYAARLKGRLAAQ
jgi:CelD/BcsL family acetyltransferase involved in cellulose biosynthesis